jgi:DNA-binding GntR family transcriptional regulator
MKEPLPRKVHAALRARMFEGALPPGTRLDYKQLAQELGVSTTPVREAVAQLASEGIVDLVPRLGAVVRSLNPITAREFYEVREAVETFAALKAAERHSPRHLELLNKHLGIMKSLYQGVLDRGETMLAAPAVHEFLDADLAFHKTILLGARNPALARTVEESHIQSRIFFADRGIHDTMRLSMACDQHTAILEALERREGTAASDAMRIHIRTSLQFTLDHLESSIEL